ncbi:MAG: adenosylcobinamide-GDP ribazoletransferase [Filifactoraceae bacterium]
MKLLIYRCISAFTFLTKIPIKYNPSIEDKDFHKNVVFFPLVGSVLGIMLCVASFVLSIKLTASMGAILLLAFYVTLTGGLHLDGVGDSFDGLFSYREKARILEIMKDSRIGTNGILGIIFVLLVKFIAFKDFIEMGSYIPILIMPIVGRIALVIGCYNGKNAREIGMGKVYIGNVIKGDFIITLLLASLLVLASISIMKSTFKIFISITICIIYVLISREFIYKKIDGITGDILGFFCETSEVLFLILCYFFG